MPCFVKCYPEGIDEELNVLVRTHRRQQLPRRKPKGLSPPDGDRVYIWTIEEGHGGDGLNLCGHLCSFCEVGKTFRFQVRNAEQRIRAFRSRDLGDRAGQSDSEASVKGKIRRNRPPIMIELTEGEADYLDRFYRGATETGNGAPDENTSSDVSDNIVSDLDAIRNDPDIGETTRARLIRARLGQGEFRDALLRRWQGACAVTGCTQGEVLRASHVLPWRTSSNEQRLNPANGILLTANLDALFDRFLISFANNGEMLISGRVGQCCRELVGIPRRLRGELTAEEKGFLGHHRDQFQDEEYTLAAGTTVLPTRVS